MCRKLIYSFSFVSLLNLVVTNVAQAADPSTLACYTFDDGTAVNVGGSAGSEADGTLQGGASIIYDAGGNGKEESYVLDVTGSPQHVNCGCYNSLNGSKLQRNDLMRARESEKTHKFEHFYLDIKIRYMII